MEFTVFEQLVYDAISERQEMKRGNGEFPDFVLIDEIYNCYKAQLLEALRALCRKGLIEHHMTVNKKPMFGVRTKTQ